MNTYDSKDDDVSWVTWDPCAEHGCQGVQLAGSERCLKHLSSAEQQTYLNGVREHRRAIDLRGTEIDEDLLGKVLNSRYSENYYYNWTAADFSYATIEVDKANFEWTRFLGDARFNGTQFTGWVDLAFCRFDRDAGLECNVEGLLRISSSQFDEGVSISWGRCGELQAEAITSKGLVLLDGARVEGDATFRQSTFDDRVVISNMKVGGSVDFAGTTWNAPTDERYSVDVRDWLILDGAEFHKPSHWSISAAVISCVGASFRDTSSFLAEGSMIILDRANFEKSTRIAGETFKDPARAASLVRLDVLDRMNSPEPMIPGAKIGKSEMGILPGKEKELAESIQPIALSDRPNLVSARRVDLHHIALTDISANRCRFFDASALDGLRWTNMSWAASPKIRARRRVVAEEIQLRASRRWSWGWSTSSAESPKWLRDPRQRPIGTAELEPIEEKPRPADIAEIYRQLRKGREDAKDTPGGADFYYGEMEMRRLAAKAFSGERALLSLYWAVSGYGLRASRSALALVVLMAIATYGMAASGYCNSEDPFGDRTSATCVQEDGSPSISQTFTLSNLSFTAGTALTIVGAPEAQLTSTGYGIRLVLRLLGPLLVALSLLALRNRVKR